LRDVAEEVEAGVVRATPDVFYVAASERRRGGIVRVQVPNGDKVRVPLLGPNTEAKKGSGVFRYRVDRELRLIIQHSSVFARIRNEVTFALSSKYALALYEMIQKRGNLAHKFSEEFTVDELRALLGVEKDKLKRFPDFNRRALSPAIKEVNALGDYGVSMQPVKSGRAVTGIKLFWSRKNADEHKEAYQELQRSRVGRRARINGTVEETF